MTPITAWVLNAAVLVGVQLRDHTILIVGDYTNMYYLLFQHPKTSMQSVFFFYTIMNDIIQQHVHSELYYY